MDPSCDVDKVKLCDPLVQATKGHVSHAALTAHKATRDGQVAMNSLIQQESSKTVWKKIAKESHHNLLNHKWTTSGTVPLNKCAALRHHWKQQMELASQHTSTAAIPNGELMVDVLVTNMKVDNQCLNAKISSVQGDNDPDGPKCNFEQAVERLLPFDPVAE